MARRSTGGIVERQTRRGLSYGIRFRALGKRQFLHVGYAVDGVTREEAERGCPTYSNKSAAASGVRRPS